jgi:hypothetical protein
MEGSAGFTFPRNVSWSAHQGEPGCSTASLVSFGRDLDRQTRLRTSTRQLHCTGKHSGCDLLLIPIDICHSTTSLISLTHDSARQARLRISTRQLDCTGKHWGCSLLLIPIDRCHSITSVPSFTDDSARQARLRTSTRQLPCTEKRPRCSITGRAVSLSLRELSGDVKPNMYRGNLEILEHSTGACTLFGKGVCQAFLKDKSLVTRLVTRNPNTS